ncbi:MAG: hypothetical protein MZV65_25035 [Chromatiales bacterium]|nr:hypothetical protein [Chromatiales bacterium]
MLDPGDGFEPFLSTIHSTIERGRPRRLLRLRLPVRPGGRLVQRPDAGQLLHAHLPLSLRPGDGGLFRAAARTPFVPRHGADSRHDATVQRSLPASATNSTSAR